MLILSRNVIDDRNRRRGQREAALRLDEAMRLFEEFVPATIKITMPPPCAPCIAGTNDARLLPGRASAARMALPHCTANPVLRFGGGK